MGTRVLVLNLPSPHGMDVNRDYAGGYGNALRVRRPDYGHSTDVLMPVSLPYLVSGLKGRGCQLRVIDAQAMRLGLPALLEQVREARPQFIVTFLSLPSIYGDLRLLSRLKEEIDGCRVVALGPVGKFLASEIMARRGVDFLVTAEFPFVAQSVWQVLQAREEPVSRRTDNVSGPAYGAERPDGPSIERNLADEPPVNESLDDFDITVYRELPVREYQLCFLDPLAGSQSYFPILSGKGCPYGCIYCPYPVGFGRRLCVKSPDLLIEEMKFLKANFGVRAFLFRDQVFTEDEKRAADICELILREDLGIDWIFETRVDRISLELLQLMKRAGCKRIHYGVETGDPDMLRRIGKPGISREVIRTTFEHTACAGIHTMAHVILGLPGENRQTAQRTYDFLMDIRPDGVSWNIATPYPGTRLFEVAKEKDLILTYDWQRYGTRDIVMRTEELSAEDLRRLARRFSRGFRIRQVTSHGLRALRDRKELGYLARRAAHELRQIHRM